MKRAADIAALLECHIADVLAINETWLSPDILDHEVIPKDYVVLQKDRSGGRRPAGGVLLAIILHLQPCRQTQLETKAEAVWAEVTVSNLRFLIASVYRAPNSTPQQNDELLLSLSLAAEQQHNYDACFVMGDFNLDVDWSTKTPLPRATPAEQFLDAFDNFAFTQLIKNATRTTATSEKTFDLFLCDTPNLVSTSEVIAGVSDHDALLIGLKVDSRRPPPMSMTLPDWRRAHWPALNDLLEVKLQGVMQEDGLEEAWTAWKTALFECVAECVPSRRTRSKRKLLPWLNKNLKKLIKIKDDLFAQWLSEKTNEARIIFEAARKATQGAVRLAKDRWFWNLGRGPQGAAVFCKFIHLKSKVPINTTTFSADGRFFSEPAAVARQFLATFKQNFSPPGTDFPFLWLAPIQDEKLSKFHVTASKVSALLHVLDAKNATGPDGIPAVLLKNCADTICPSFAHIFKLWLQLASCRQTGSVQRVTSLIGKLLEKHVRNQLAAFFESKNSLPDCQHGFRERRSCTTMLLKTLDNWTAALDSSRQQQFFSTGQKHSTGFHISGCCPSAAPRRRRRGPQVVEKLPRWPQPVRSVLGPLLFNIYVSDLPAALKTNLVQYADDCTVFKVVSCQDDVDELQDDLALVDIWCTNNGMQLNAKKCVAMNISGARQPWTPQYTIGGVVLDYVCTQRLLGVHISRDLRYNHHVDVQRKKAARSLGFAARNLRGCTQRVKRMAYLTLVKP
ncbi:Hypothetical predicted protein [Cloeon dipterum]|uniref:Reverse transcriptase domain-containing protein n=1 Tax=Cloeon dipterum TaxID=197152 RepID=A0A8S1DVP8_9INSE|nr:Hypothetical predicted protein [Cloeon dipterum]